MLIIDIFDENPFYLEISFEFKCMVLPPEREGFLMVA